MKEQPVSDHKIALIEAIDDLRQRCLEDPNNPKNHLELGKLLQVGSDKNQAIFAYRRAIEIQPDLVEAYLGIAQCYQSMGFMHRAINIYEDLLIKKPNNVNALFSLGEIYRKMNDIEQAYQCWLTAYQMNPENVDLARSFSSLAYQAGHNKKALEVAEKIVANPQANSEDWHQLGLLYANSKTNQLLKAQTAYEKALQVDQPSCTLLCNYANCLAKLEQFSQAREYYDRALQIEPKNADLWFNFGDFCWKSQNEQEAFYAFQQTVKINPKDGEAWFRLAQALGVKNATEAEKCLKKAEQLEFRSGEFFLLCAQIAEHHQRYADSFQLRKKAQLKLPMDVQNNTQLGLAWLKRGQFLEAWNCLKRITEPSDLNLWNQIAQHMRHGGWLEQELAILEQLAKQKTQQPYLWHRLGQISLQKNNVALAGEYFAKSRSDLPLEPRTKLFLFEQAASKKQPLKDFFQWLVADFACAPGILWRSFQAAERAKLGSASLPLEELTSSENLAEVIGLHAWIKQAIDRGKTEEAKPLLDKLSSKNVFPALSKQLFCLWHQEKKQFSALMSWLQDLPLSENESASYYAYLAESQMNSGQMDAAYRSIEKAHAQEENHRFTLLVEAKWYMKKEQWQQALYWIEQGLKISAFDSPFFALKASILLHQQELSQAKAAAQESVRRSAHLAAGWVALGEVAASQKLMKQAHSFYLRALVLRPQDHEIQQKVQFLRQAAAIPTRTV